MWEEIRSVWQRSSIFIVGLVVIFGAIYLVGHLSSSTNTTPAASQNQAASSDQDRDRAKPVVASTATTSPQPQGGSAKQPPQQLAQSNKAPSQPPANQDKPTPTPSVSAAVPTPAVSAAAPSPTAAPSQPAHDMHDMAANNTPPPSATIGQSPAPAAPKALPPASNAAPAASDTMSGDASAGRLVFRKCQACHSIDPGKDMLGPSLAGVIGRKAGTEAVATPSGTGQGRRNGADFLWRRWTELHIVVPRHRRDLRQGLPVWRRDQPTARGLQTVTVPPGGAVTTEFKTQVPGNYTILDHAIARAERGLSGILSVEGAPNPEIYMAR
jgi:hypothetical protein